MISTVFLKIILYVWLQYSGVIGIETNGTLKLLEKNNVDNNNNNNDDDNNIGVVGQLQHIFKNLFDFPLIEDPLKIFHDIDDSEDQPPLNTSTYSIKDLCVNGFGPVYKQCPNAKVSSVMLCRRSLRNKTLIVGCSLSSQNNTNANNSETFGVERFMLKIVDSNPIPSSNKPSNNTQSLNEESDDETLTGKFEDRHKYHHHHHRFDRAIGDRLSYQSDIDGNFGPGFIKRVLRVKDDDNYEQTLPTFDAKKSSVSRFFEGIGAFWLVLIAVGIVKLVIMVSICGYFISISSKKNRERNLERLNEAKNNSIEDKQSVSFIEPETSYLQQNI